MLLNGFQIEFKRQKLAENKDKKNLNKLYDPKLPEIKDLNTPKFWDKKFIKEENLDTQDGMTRDRVRAIVSYIPEGKLKVLDIGAGLGFAEELISKDKDKILYANDFSSVSVNKLRKKFKGNFTKQSIYNLKYPKDFFDVVLVLEVLEHIPPSRIFNVLKSIKSLLKANGVLIISVPMNEGLEKMKDNPNNHLRMYTKDLIQSELEMSGFRLLEYKFFYAFPNIYTFKKLASKIFINKWKPNNIVIKAIRK